MAYETPVKKTKRPLDIDRDDDEHRPTQSIDYWPHFVVIETHDKTPLKLNPFAVSKAIQGIAEKNVQGQLDVTDFKDTFLECSVCVEHFNQTNRRPRHLNSCLHAFCTICLQTLLTKEGGNKITCPLCRQVQTVRGTADTLPIDPVRDKLTEYLQMKIEKKTFCTDCPDGNEAESRYHKDHEIRKLENAAEAKKAKIEQNLQRITKMSELTQEALEKDANQKGTITAIMERSEYDINTLYNSLTNAVERKRKRQLAYFNKRSLEALATVKTTAEAHRQTMAKIEATQGYVTKLEETADAVEMLQMYPSIMGSMEGITEVPECQDIDRRNLRFKTDATAFKKSLSECADKAIADGMYLHAKLTALMRMVIGPKISF
ncbi:E3 ubiquitin-protein ligase TRIM17-like [Haliotis rubra]|uniref:E3 ubiquitin-protein ligase TRIM17-like n=1 Tax=Haliotis rubra TaxID=36100 RepID=UPI001EE540BF|nr:E3 ubiquitin-protein ligase TRIM17-like [Haliotis rubra]